MNDKLTRIDFGIFITTLVMVGFSIVLVYSSSFAIAQERYLAGQVFRALLSLGCFMVFMNIDYHFWARNSRVLFICAIILLIAVFGCHASHGAHRWIKLGFVRFQASEIARFVLIIVLAARCSEDNLDIRNFKKLVSLLVKVGIICGLVVIEPDFGTAFAIGLLGVCMLFVAGARFWHLIALGASVLPVAAIILISAPYRRNRIMAFFHASEYKSSIGYQAYQSILGLGHGGIFGVGLGHAESKNFYLPEPHTDFAFSVLGEEIGFVGLLVVFLIFGILIYRGFSVARTAPDKMGQLMAFGITFMVAFYLIVHAFVNTGLMPTKGAPMPFLSYGGMSLIFTVSSIGILLNISSQARVGIPWQKKIDKKRMVKL